MSMSAWSVNVIFPRKVFVLDIFDVDMIRVSTPPQVAVRGGTSTGTSTSISINTRGE